MATILTQSSGSPLIGSPIVYPIKADLHVGAVFHRVKLQVVAGLQGGNYQTIEMSSPAIDDASLGTGETINFDIASALQAVADSYEYEATPPEYYPYVQYYLIAWDEWMQNGVTYESSKDYFPDNYQSAPFRALMGAYSDMERLLAGEQKQTLHFSRKPATSPEVVFVGDTFVHPTDMAVHSLNIQHGPQSVVYNVTQEGLQTLGGAQIYALPADSYEHYQMRFVNGLGAMESLSLRSLRKVTVDIVTKQYTRAIQETFGRMSRGMAVKQNDYEKWVLTSGAIDQAWASWFIHELLMAEEAWVLAGGIWLRCHILPDESITLEDRTKAAPYEVQITIQMDIKGSTMSALAI